MKKSSDTGILVYANEAGSAAYLAHCIKKHFEQEIVMGIWASPGAAEIFLQSGLKVSVIEEKPENRKEQVERIFSQKPTQLWLGTSCGISLEKELLLGAKRKGIPVWSFVDHYWNLWQRFARTPVEKWFYCPDMVITANKQIQNRLELQKIPFITRVLEHHTFSENTPHLPPMTMAKQALGFSPEDKLLLFVSEYLLEDEEGWDWDQATCRDYEHLLISLLVKAAEIPDWYVLIKYHPLNTENWNHILNDFPESTYREVRSCDINVLLGASDKVFGLNSMLLIEAAKQKKSVYTMHCNSKNRSGWLSTLHPEILEIENVADAFTHW